jgi:hypothetical protein
MEDEEAETEARHVERASGRALPSLTHLCDAPWLLSSNSKSHRA